MKKIIISFMIIISFLVFNVYADEKPVNILLNGAWDRNLPYSFWVNPGGYKGQIGATAQYENQEYQFIIATACISWNMAGANTQDFTISNASMTGGALENGKVNKYNTGVSCNFDNISGNYWRIYYKINNWYLAPGQDRYEATSNINYAHNMSGGAYFITYTSFYLSTEDTFLLDSSASNQTTIIQNSINQMTQQQQQTNVKLDENKQAINNNTNAINQTNDTMKDDDVDDPSDMFDDFEDMLPDNGVITSLISLPITLIEKVNDSIDGSCTAFSLGTLFGEEIILPCIDISDYLGTTLWNVIDILCSGFFVLAISKKMVKVFENFSSMKDGDVLDD